MISQLKYSQMECHVAPHDSCMYVLVEISFVYLENII